MEVQKGGKVLDKNGIVAACVLCWSRFGVGRDRGGQREGEIDGGAKK